MCFGLPGKVLRVDGWIARVDFWGVRKDVRLDLLDEPVKPGDYILHHLGRALRRIPPDDVEETLALYEGLVDVLRDSA